MNAMRRVMQAGWVTVALVSGLAQAQDAAGAGAEAFESGRYAQALVLFEQASDQGDAQSAERAGQMWLLGAPVYGHAVPQDLSRALRHLVRAARAGRPGAQRWLELIGFPLQLDEAPAPIGASGC